MNKKFESGPPWKRGRQPSNRVKWERGCRGRSHPKARVRAATRGFLFTGCVRISNSRSKNELPVTAAAWFLLGWLLKYSCLNLLQLPITTAYQLIHRLSDSLSLPPRSNWTPPAPRRHSRGGRGPRSAPSLCWCKVRFVWCYPAILPPGDRICVEPHKKGTNSS